jgi:hypothetical protein
MVFRSIKEMVLEAAQKLPANARWNDVAELS